MQRFSDDDPCTYLHSSRIIQVYKSNARADLHGVRIKHGHHEKYLFREYNIRRLEVLQGRKKLSLFPAKGSLERHSKNNLLHWMDMWTREGLRVTERGKNLERCNVPFASSESKHITYLVAVFWSVVQHTFIWVREPHKHPQLK